MRNIKNTEKFSGRLYDISKLAKKTVANTDSKSYGQEYIGGSVDIATDDDCLNVVTVNFTFVQPTYKSGKENKSYAVLNKLLESGKTVVNDGKDAATLVSVDGAIDVNDFYTQRNGEEVLVSAKRNAGSFINIINKLPEDNRSIFECDMLINGTQYVEADEEKHIDTDYLIVKGATFAYGGRLLPLEFIVKNIGGIKYFESLNASPDNLVFTKVWGTISSSTIVERREEESAFGEPSVKEITRTRKEYVITGTSRADAVYPIDDEKDGITKEEIKKAMADREVYLAEVKQKADEYQNSKNAGTASNVASAPAAQGGFTF